MSKLLLKIILTVMAAFRDCHNTLSQLDTSVKGTREVMEMLATDACRWLKFQGTAEKFRVVAA